MARARRYPAGVRIWPFGHGPKQEHSLGEYTEPSFRGALLMLVVCIVLVALVWLAYSWALNHPQVPDPGGPAYSAARSVAAMLPV